MKPPENPNAEQARADIMAYSAPLLVNPPADDAALLARAVATWPDMTRHLSDAHIGIGMAFDGERGVMVERMTIVIEIKGDYPQ